LNIRHTEKIYMKNARSKALTFLSLHTVATLALSLGQMMDVHWFNLNEHRLNKLHLHPALATASISVSLTLLLLLWLKNERTYRFVYVLALAGCIYGALLVITNGILFGFMLVYGAVCIIHLHAPYGWPGVNKMFSHPGRRTDGDEK
jgi:hypothetical protein